jgi:cysteine desulfuration protein SufE
MAGTVDTTGLPTAFAEIAEDFSAASTRQRLDLLLEFSDELPALPERYVEHRDRMEKVDECQSPVFLTVELESADGGDDPVVHLHFDAPPEAPTTRGFAGILHAGLDGLPASTLLAVPDDAPMRLGLAEAVSPLRLRGMVGMLGRIKRQVALKTAATTRR